MYISGGAAKAGGVRKKVGYLEYSLTKLLLDVKMAINIYLTGQKHIRHFDNKMYIVPEAFPTGCIMQFTW